MSSRNAAIADERLALVRWTARIGAVTAGAVAEHYGITVTAARARLLAAQRVGLLQRVRPLREEPSLFTATRAGIRLVGLAGVEPSRVSAANASHAVACAAVAVALARGYPDHVVSGERELRREERVNGAPLASVRLLGAPHHGRNHRPDLVLWRAEGAAGLPVAVEVELTVKAPLRLRQICLAWARCPCVAGVLYVAAPAPFRALARAIRDAQAERRVVLLGLEALAPAAGAAAAPESPVAGAA